MSNKKQLSRERFLSSLIAYFKSKPCMDCKTQYQPWVMQYDHRPTEDKRFNLSAESRKREFSVLDTINEIKKCDVVCANCHADRTMFRRIGQSGIETYSDHYKTKSFYGKTLEEFEKELQKEPTERILKNRAIRASAGRGQPRPNKRKVERPSKEELAKMVWEIPAEKIADKFGVTGNSIRKWCILYKVDKPSRGYWTKVKSGKMAELVDCV